MSPAREPPDRPGSPLAAGWPLALAGLSGLSLLTFAVAGGWLSGPDHGLLDLLSTVRGPVPDVFFQAVTWLGSAFFLTPLALLALVWLAARQSGRVAARLAIAYFGAALTTWLLKQLVGRERPDQYPPLADFIGADWSFPSGHTTHAAAFALGVWLVLGAGRPGARTLVGPVLVTLVCLVALSRLYLQVHWPSDVLAGLLVALAWAGVAVAVTRPGLRQRGTA